jgi:hypothetical protein
VQNVSHITCKQLKKNPSYNIRITSTTQRNEFIQLLEQITHMVQYITIYYKVWWSFLVFILHFSLQIVILSYEVLPMMIQCYQNHAYPSPTAVLAVLTENKTQKISAART